MAAGNDTMRERTIMVNSLTCLLRAMEGWETTIELRNENTAYGTVTSVDYLMNLSLTNCVFTKLDGTTIEMDYFYVQGKNIRFVHIPDEMNIMRAIMGQVNKFNKGINRPSTPRRVDFHKRKLLKKLDKAQKAVDALGEMNRTGQETEKSGKPVVEVESMGKLSLTDENKENQCDTK